MDDPLIFRILATATLVVASLFIALFAREPWWKQPFGQSVMIMGCAIWLHALAATLRQWLGLDYPGRDLIRGFAQAGLLFAMAQRLVVLWRARHRGSTPQ